MQLLFLGAGSGFTVGENNYQSNMLLIDQAGDNLLIDCGTDARFSLYEQGYTSEAIKNVYISHLHADHAGGLEWLGFTTLFGPQGYKPNLFISDKLADELWNNSLSGGMRSLSSQKATAESYFNVISVKNTGPFNWANIEFYLVRTYHIHHGEELRPSFGLFFTLNNHNIFISTDTQFNLEFLKEYYEKADLIFHDCETMEGYRSGVHAHYDELCTLPKKIKKKMWLYHYNDGKTQDPKKDHFRGFVQKGQKFDLLDKETYK